MWPSELGWRCRRNGRADEDTRERRGGIAVLVRRDDARREDGRSTEHASERSLEGERPDTTIGNSGSVEELEKALAGEWTSLMALAERRLATLAELRPFDGGSV